MRNFLFFFGPFFAVLLLGTVINNGAANQQGEFHDSWNPRFFRAAVNDFAFANQPEIGAQSAILMEAKSNAILFERNIHEVRPSASLAKIFTGIAAYEEYSSGIRVRISPEALLRNGSHFKRFSSGEVYTVDALLHSLLIESDNVAAYALASLMGRNEFVRKMNEKAELLGLKETLLFGPAGLDEEKSQTSAWDIAKTGEYLLYNEGLSGILRMGTYLLYDADGRFRRKVFTTNELWGMEGLVAAKTGFTDEAQGNLLIIVRHPKKDGEFLISVVMGSKDRAGDTLKLLNLIQ